MHLVGKFVRKTLSRFYLWNGRGWRTILELSNFRFNGDLTRRDVFCAQRPRSRARNGILSLFACFCQRLNASTLAKIFAGRLAVKKPNCPTQAKNRLEWATVQPASLD